MGNSKNSSGIVWGLINQGAVDWVKNSKFNHLVGFDNSTIEFIRESLVKYFTERLLKKDLMQLLEPTLDHETAIDIATTETTRAVAEAERIQAEEIEGANPHIKMIPKWLTANDDLVCAFCKSRHGKQISDNIYPPAHKRCSCWVNHEMTII